MMKVSVNEGAGCKEKSLLTKWISAMQWAQPSHMGQQLKPDYTVCGEGLQAPPEFAAQAHTNIMDREYRQVNC